MGDQLIVPVSAGTGWVVVALRGEAGMSTVEQVREVLAAQATAARPG